MRWFCFALALAACQPVATIPDRPVDTPYVEFGNGGSITGGGVITTVYANDQLYRRYTSPRPGEGRTEWEELPEGSFQEIKSVAHGQFALLPKENAPLMCMDAGTDRLVIVEFDFVESRYENTCPTDAARAAFAALRTEVVRQQAFSEE